MKRLLFTLFFCLPIIGNSAQISLVLDDYSLKELISGIESQSEFKFAYGNDINIETKFSGSYTFKNKELNDILEKLSERTPFVFSVLGNNITITEDLPVKKYKVKKSIFQLSVTGKVTDANGIPLPSVTIREEGTNNGVLTDFDGNFTIEVSSNDAVLVFTYVGMETFRRTVGGDTTVNVQMKEDSQALDEIVVVGYGTQKKVNLTGSVSVISSEEIVSQPVGQTSAALQGVAPGVTITQRSGQPGADGSAIRIRGLGTLGDSDPLVLVDGIESNLDNVAPNEIESISVLKDAASASIYGARAANGVVLVTTKRGSAGLKINYNAFVSLQEPTDMPDIVNAIDHMEMMNEAYTNVGREPLWSEEQIAAHRNGMPSDNYPNTDWQELTLKDNAFMQNQSLSINAGGEIAKVFASFGYLDQEGIIPNTNFKRYNLRLNSDIKITDKLKSSVDISLIKSERIEPSVGVDYIFHWMRRIPANEVGVLSNGRYGEGWNGDHPLARAVDGGLGTRENLNAILNFRLNYQITDWLAVEGMFAPRTRNPHNRTFSNITQSYARDGVTPTFAVPQRNSLTEYFEREWYNNSRVLITADKTLNDVHHFNFMAGFQQEDQFNQWISAYREVFPLPQYQRIDAGNEENDNNAGSANHWALRSYFGRAKYNFQDKYLFEANIRRDGSSRFAEGNRYGIFPSFSAAWRLSEESFMEGVSNVVQQLKLRVSWGQLGNQNIGLYPYAAFVQLGGGGSDYIFNSSISPGAALNDLGNPNIAWETSEMTNIGVDIRLWNRWDITFEYYNRITNDILLPLNIPLTLGLNAPFQNAGKVENRGWDFSTTYRNNISEMNYGITFNLSDVKNEILDMKGIQQSGLTVNREGHPIGSFFGYEAIGLFQSQAEVNDHADQFGAVAPGDIKYKDLNNDGVINDDDLTVIGSPIPRYTYGLRLNADYKNFDISFFMQGVGKVDGYLYGQGIMPFYLGGTVQEKHKDRWTPENPDAEYPRFAFNQVNNEVNSSFWMRDAAYLRVKNVQIGYTLPEGTIGNVKRIHIYLSGRNLFTVTDFYKGYDPEAPVSNGGWYPQMKSYTVGLNVNL